MKRGYVLALFLVGVSAFGQDIMTIQPQCSLTVVNNSLDNLSVNQNFTINSGDTATTRINCPGNLGTGELLANTGYRAQISSANQEIIIKISGKNIAQCVGDSKTSCFNLLGSNQICAPCVGAQTGGSS